MTVIEQAVRSVLGVPVRSTQPVAGGCISEARRVELADGRVIFAKCGTGLPPDLLAVEAEGLGWLAEPDVVSVPGVIGLHRGATDADGSTDSDVLLLDWIEPGEPQPDTDARLGAGLAHLHRAGADGFGWHRDGFIGSLPQANLPSAPDWPTFWFTRRLVPLARRAVDRGSLQRRAPALVDRLGDRLAELAGPPEPPARVHGDLWSGNVLVGTGGRPWLIDPAPYGGHREIDLAMLHLFGNPGPGVVDAYQEVAPLAPGWRERLPLWQLEPLLVHAVLFGGGYGPQALAVIDRFV